MYRLFKYKQPVGFAVDGFCLCLRCAGNVDEFNIESSCIYQMNDAFWSRTCDRCGKEMCFDTEQT